MPQRLPIVDGDDGQWGTILNQYLGKEHFDDATDNPLNGGHKTVTIRAGTAAAGTAPLKIASGTILTTPEAGAVEFNTDRLYYTQTTGTVRRVVAAFDDATDATGDLHYVDASGNFTKLGIGSSTQVLTVTSGLPSWQTPSGGGGSSGPTLGQVIAIATSNGIM
jgi:hypothetical protein